MTTDQANSMRHRRIAFRLEFTHAITRERDEDLYFGDYADHRGEHIGQVLRREGDRGHLRGLLFPDETVPLMHVESALDADHAVESYGMVVALVYGPGEEAPVSVINAGEFWDAGETQIYLFADDEAAALARG